MHLFEARVIIARIPFTMRNFAEGARLAHALKRADLSKPEDRQDFFQSLSDAHPSLKGALSPEGALAFLDRAEGIATKRDNQPVTKFGAGLLDLEMRLKRGEVGLTEGDRKLINRGTAILEKNLFNGNLASATEERAATIAFIANRIGKIKEQTGDPKLRSLDEQKFLDLVAKVNAFAEDELSEERINKRIEYKTAELAKEIEAQERIDDPALAEYVRSNKEIRAREKMISDAIGSEKIQEEFKEIAAFLKEVSALITSKKPELSCLRGMLSSVEDFFLKQNPKDLLSQWSSEQSFFQIITKEGLADFQKKRSVYTHDEQYSQAQARYFEVLGELKWHIDESKKQQASASSGRLKGLAALRGYDPEGILPKLERTFEILRKWLYNEIPGTFQELQLAQGKNAVARLAQQKLRRTLLQNPLFAESQKRIDRIQKEKNLLERARTRLPLAKATFQRSKNALVRDIVESQENNNGLYFIKSFCVAADRLDEAEQLHGGPLFVPPTEIASKPIETHQFLRYEHRDEVTDSTKKYSDVHFRSLDLPFALMAVEYFKSFKEKDAFAQRPPREAIKGKFKEPRQRPSWGWEGDY